MFQSPVATPNNWTFTRERFVLPSPGLRYAGSDLPMLAATTATAAEVRVPINALVRKKVVDATSTVLEIEPLLTAVPRNLWQQFTMGTPTIYLHVPGLLPDATFPDGQRYLSGDSLGNFLSFKIGIRFSDALERDAVVAAEIVATALSAAGVTGSWTAFFSAISTQLNVPPLQLLNASGQAFHTDIPLRLVRPDTSVLNFNYLQTTHRGDLRSLLTNEIGTLAPDEPGNLAEKYLWVSRDSSGAVTVDVGSITLTATTRALSLINLHDWFAPQFASGTPNLLPRFTRGNRVTHFVNGPGYFEDLFTALKQAGESGTDGRFFLVGLTLKESDQLVRDGLNLPQTVLEAAQRIADAGGQCYFLPSRFLNLTLSEADMEFAFRLAVFLGTAIIGVGGLLKYGGNDANPNELAFGITIPITMIGGFIAMALAEDIISGDIAEKQLFSGSAVENLNFGAPRPSGGNSRSQFAAHPGRWEDNPNDFPGDSIIEALAKTVLTGFHFFHQKIAVVRKSDGWAGYCGGIDLNPNRLDDERHLSKSLYHDVQSRLDGPAVRDLAVTVAERWNAQNPLPADQISLAATDLPPTTTFAGGTDIVQIARTYFRPNPATGAARAFSYAPNGDRTLIDTVLQAIRQAREYIYIEDQYFTPSVEYQEALIEAVGRVKTVIVLVPSSSDMIYGQIPRSKLVEALVAADPRAGTPDPVVRVGFSRQGYSVPTSDWRTAMGRMRLGDDLDSTATSVKLGPSRRVPTAPFWFSVNGEVMLATKVTHDPGDDESDAAGTGGSGSTGSDERLEEKYKTFEVQRGTALNFSDKSKGPGTRSHKKGNAATAVQFRGIFIHAKLMLIDDVFASVGSANLNRRGFYSDTEANLFTVPEALRFTADNPVRNLRKKLWAEILNLPPGIGSALLDDAVASARLFDRTCFSGNRFVPYRAIADALASELHRLPGGGNFALNGSTTVWSQLQNMLLFLATGIQNLEYDEVFYLISDPTSFLQTVPDDPTTL